MDKMKRSRIITRAAFTRNLSSLNTELARNPVGWKSGHCEITSIFRDSKGESGPVRGN